jgi:N-acyl-D-amino-acid deacylase
VTDVALADGTIAVVGDCSEREAFVTIACDGLALAPGFIDVHSHSDELWLADGRMLGKITQGVTTEIGGNCGTSAAPLYGTARERKTRDAHEYRVDVDWTTFDQFFGAVERGGIAANVASLVGLAT